MKKKRPYLTIGNRLKILRNNLSQKEFADKIGIPLVTAFGAYWMRTAKQSSDSISTINDLVKSLNSELSNLDTRLAEAKFGVDSAAEADALQRIADLNFQIAQKKEEYRNTDSLSARQNLAEEWNGLQNQAASLQVIVDKIEDQRSAYEKVKSSIQENINQHLVYYNSLSKAAKDQAASLAWENNIRQELLIKVNAIKSSMESSSKIDIKHVFSDALNPSSGLLGNVTTLYDKMVALASLANNAPGGKGYLANQYAQYGQGHAAQDKLTRESSPLYGGFSVLGDKPATSTKGSGGGSSASDLEAKMQDLYKYLDATKEVNKYLIIEEDKSYQDREDLLKSALDKKMIALQDYQQYEQDLTRRHQEELAKIEKSKQDQKLQDTATFFGGLAAVAQAGGDKTTKAARVFSAAQALINSYLAFTQVLADPSLIGRPWARFGMAASALASGLQAVAAIKSGGGGSISGGGGSVGTSSTPTTPANPQQVLIQGLKPTDIFTGEQLSTLFDSLYKENKNRGMVFMVQRG